MKVLYDHQVFSMQAYGGVSRLFGELIRHIAKTGIDVAVFGGIYINEYISGIESVRGIKVRPLRGTMLIRRALNHSAQQIWSLIRSYDVIHYTYYAPYLWPGKAKKIVTVYDMIHERFGRSNSRTALMKKRSCLAADAIIAISQSTKNDVVELLRIDPRKITVIYPGNSMIGCQAVTKPRRNETQYLLYVGARGAYKNFERFACAFASSEMLKKQIRILCFGGGAFSAEERNILARLGIASLVDRIDGSDGELSTCYSEARAFVYPSLYEGFGFPPLEAMSQGCPVICSNTSSIPEVVGDAGVYFDPYNVESMCRAMERVIFDDALAADLALRGRERSVLFSWEKCARETRDVYYIACKR